MTVPVPARHLATDDLFFRRPEEAAAAVVNDGSRVLAADAATESMMVCGRPLDCVINACFKKCALSTVSSRRMMMVPPQSVSSRGISLDFGKARVVVVFLSLSLTLSLVLERKSNNTLERFHSRRRPEEDPKENDNNSKRVSFVSR